MPYCRYLLFFVHLPRWFGTALLWLSLGAGALPAWAEDGEAEAATTTEAGAADTTDTDTDAAAGADTEAAAPGADSGSELPHRVTPDLPHNREQSVIRHLQQHQRPHEAVEMVAAETAFTGLLLRNRSRNPQGGVLILHDQGQHSHWPDSAGPLREYLPDYGWTTLSIALPDAPPATLPPRSEPLSPTPANTDGETAAEATAAASDDNNSAAADTAAENIPTAPEPADSNGLAGPGTSDNNASNNNETMVSDNEPALPRLTGLPPLPETTTAAEPEVPAPSAADHYREQMLQRISAGVSQLQSMGQMNLVIVAHGHSAAWAIAWLQQEQPAAANGEEQGYALVLIDALENSYAPLRLQDALSGLQLPLLDLLTPYNRNSEFTNRERAGRMHSKQREAYQQIRIPALSLRADYANTVTRRVRGWLKTNAAGRELER